MKGSRGRNSKQELIRQEVMHGGVLRTGLLLMVCLGCFLIQARATSPGVTPSTIGRVLPHQLLIEITLHRLVFRSV